MHKKTIFLYINIFIIGLFIFLIGIYIGQGKFYLFNLNNNSPSNEYLIDEVRSLINSDYYVKNSDNNALVYSSIKGMVSSLNDPATIFLDPTDEKKFENNSSGNTFAGIGVELGFDNKTNIVIKRILPQTPASKNSDIKVNDIIQAINNKKISDINKNSLDKISYIKDQIRGIAGTSISLGLIDPTSNKNFNVDITREPIHVSSMYIDKITTTSGKKLDDLVVSRFTDDTIADWENEWDSSIKSINQDAPDGLVIDLRDNPGGFFDAAVYSLADLLPKETLVAMQEDRNSTKTNYKTDSSPRLSPNLKISILVNSNTASAAEIFSGALQFYKRANIIGIPTYGKGTAQEVKNFSDGSALHLTVDHWLLPSGRWIQSSDPIKPDININNSNEDYINGQDSQLDKAVGLF